jgi:hypothetical protein
MAFLTRLMAAPKTQRTSTVLKTKMGVPTETTMRTAS